MSKDWEVKEEETKELGEDDEGKEIKKQNWESK